MHLSRFMLERFLPPWPSGSSALRVVPSRETDLAPFDHHGSLLSDIMSSCCAFEYEDKVIRKELIE